jgi:uncharacterized cupredoxin-like copper-binding protein
MVSRSIGVALCSLLLAAGIAGAKPTGQVIKVRLEDASTDPAIEHMRIALDRKTVKPGRITFEAVNASKVLKHEIIVAHSDYKLPFDQKSDRVKEGDVRILGEISDLTPGKTGTLTLNLGPGSYTLFCNEPGHYKDGMIASVVVAATP